jgi:hypothetical protein
LKIKQNILKIAKICLFLLIFGILLLSNALLLVQMYFKWLFQSFLNIISGLTGFGWSKNAKNAEKTVKIVKKQQKCAYFCLFLAKKARKLNITDCITFILASYNVFSKIDWFPSG